MLQVFDGVYLEKEQFFTINLVPGIKVYTERLVKINGQEYRSWDAYKSKLCGAMKKGLKNFPFREGTKILYLGASTGTTISHLSDVVGPSGEVYGVEISPQCMNSLMKLANQRTNVIPIHGDAKKPFEYEEVGRVDVIYMDVAQPDQPEILIKNAHVFLESGSIAMICVKSQSIDVTRRPDEIFREVEEKLSKDFEIIEKMKLEPYDKDHIFLVLKMK